MDSVGKERIEQLVFGVNLVPNGNQVVLLAKTEEIQRDDLEFILDKVFELQLFDNHYVEYNLCSFLLPSGLLLLGRLTPSDLRPKYEYYFQCMIISSGLFLNSGANPLSLLTLALNSGKFVLYHSGQTLQAFNISNSGSYVDFEGINRTTNNLGNNVLLALLQSTIISKQTWFVSRYSSLKLINCIFSLLPINARYEFSFSSDFYFKNDSSFSLVGKTSANYVPFSFRDPIYGICSFLDLRDDECFNKHFYSFSSWVRVIEVVLTRRLLVEYSIDLVEHYLIRREEIDEEDDNLTPVNIEQLGRSWFADICDGKWINSDDFDPLEDREEETLNEEEMIFTDGEIIRETPVAILCAKFPERSGNLNKLDEAVQLVLSQNIDKSINNLKEVWKEVVNTFSFTETREIMNVYMDEWKLLQNDEWYGDDSKHLNLVKAIHDVFKIMSGRLFDSN